MQNDYVAPVAVINWLITNVAIAKDVNMTAKPTIPAIIIFFASSIWSSFPLAVIHLKPPQRIIRTATIDKNPNMTLIMVKIIVLKSLVPNPIDCA